MNGNIFNHPTIIDYGAKLAHFIVGSKLAHSIVVHYQLSVGPNNSILMK